MPKIGDIVNANLGNLYFGGRILMICRVDDNTNQYCIELPCGLFIRTTTIKTE